MSKARAACAAIMLALVVSTAAMVKASPVQAEDAAPSREQLIKAAFLYNFTRFVEWPARSFSAGRDPIVIGVLGQSASAAVLVSALQQTVEGRAVNGRRVIVKRVDGAGEASTVHVLFVSASDEAQFDKLKPAIEYKSVLTVGESSSFLHAGGMINFFVEGDKVRFEISAAAAERAGLRITAHLQKLAKPAPVNTSSSTHTDWSSHAPVS